MCRVQAFLEDFAKERNLQTKRDAAGNMVISRPGSGGGEQAPPVVIQGHIDMVTEKNSDSKHDFFNDPIRLVRDGDWLKVGAHCQHLPLPWYKPVLSHCGRVDGTPGGQLGRSWLVMPTG